MGQLTPAFAMARLASEQAQAAAGTEHTPATGDDNEYTPEAAGDGSGWMRDPTSESYMELGRVQEH